MHSPDDALDAAERRVPLVLAGHTHGGQVCLPFLGAMVTCSRFGRRFARGRHYLNGTVLYICRGLGSHRHVRLLSRPEVVRFTLRRA
jgi:predicted MPP superfamily phosphohydrolase